MDAAGASMSDRPQQAASKDARQVTAALGLGHRVRLALHLHDTAPAWETEHAERMLTSWVMPRAMDVRELFTGDTRSG
jgi:hypothetical protein